MEMTNSRTQEQDGAGDEPSSDDDSVSLLCDLKPWQSSPVAEDMDVDEAQFGKKKQEKEVVTEINGLKAPVSGISSYAVSDYTSQSGDSKQCMKVPKKMKINKRNGMGETLLHRACKKGDLAHVEALIQAGISVNTQDFAGWTALHEASAFGLKAVVEELLKAGADVHARSCDGILPLHDAICAGHHQVVKLLLQYGSNPSDRTGAGLSALDMAEEEEIRELLSLPVSLLTDEQPCEGPPGAMSPEARRLSCSDTASTLPRVSGDRGGDRALADVQPGRKDTSVDGGSTEALAVILDEVGRTQTEIAAWRLTGPEDAGRNHAALMHIQSVMTEVLTRQQLEKDNLARKYRSMPGCLRQRLLRSQLVSLACRQRTIVDILEKQLRLVELNVTTEAKPSNRSSHRGGSRKATSSAPQTTALRATPRSQAAVPLPSGPSAPPLAQQRRAAPPTDVLKDKAGILGCRAKPPRKTLQHVHSQIQGDNALVQACADDSSARLSQLIQTGVLVPGSTLQLLLKGRGHLAVVQGDGSIKDGRGKSHRALERWLEAILGNNIPVSATYAWDKVTFANKPLSHYALNMEAERDEPHSRPQVDVQRRAAVPLPNELTTEAASLRRLMGIKTIHLVGDDELLPNAVMERYWKKLLEMDPECEDWSRGFP
ncbi:ankyrin repeat domain-containing protein 31-like [Pungitius pungitius]|uniref:ankyrin repeat domain-containing protein 31-like n=1 Tax=Pungitius pungitius TaxID=134920 RepID=UPI002E10AA09